MDVTAPATTVVVLRQEIQDDSDSEDCQEPLKTAHAPTGRWPFTGIEDKNGAPFGLAVEQHLSNRGDYSKRWMFQKETPA
jgi:hypothetical protein